jgi:hypothetical protein
MFYWIFTLSFLYYTCFLLFLNLPHITIPPKLVQRIPHPVMSSHVILCCLGADGWAEYEDPFPASPQYSEDDEEGEEDADNNVTMVLPSAAKILARE